MLVSFLFRMCSLTIHKCAKVINSHFNTGCLRLKNLTLESFKGKPFFFSSGGKCALFYNRRYLVHSKCLWYKYTFGILRRQAIGFGPHIWVKRAALEFSIYEDLGGLLLCSRYNTEFVNMLAHIKYLFWTLFGNKKGIEL